ncbi:MAG: SAM-dependent methyltransferase [Clostridia bacterium]|nr:SAM-dependent methyltransferase [Clostridia bacterium]
MIALTNRLAMVAGLTRDGRPFADIGTDHAYLPASLVEEGRVPHAAASDVRPGPLQNAAATLEKYGLSDKVELLLCSGFEHPALEAYTDFVMAGMGGNLMVDLLTAAPFLQREGTHLVLQPQSHAEDVRDWLYRNGFSVLRETATVDNGRVYIALETAFTGETREATLSECYLGRLPESTAPERFDFFRDVLRRLTARHDALLSYPEEQEECRLLEPVIADVKALLDTESNYGGNRL